MERQIVLRKRFLNSEKKEYDAPTFSLPPTMYIHARSPAPSAATLFTNP
jgi:hypothetical protein